MLILKHRKSASIHEVEHTALQLYRAEMAIRGAVRQGLLAESIDKIHRMADDLRCSRYDLESAMVLRDNTDGRWQLTEQHLAARGLIDPEGE